MCRYTLLRLLCMNYFVFSKEAWLPSAFVFIDCFHYCLQEPQAIANAASAAAFELFSLLEEEGIVKQIDFLRNSQVRKLHTVNFPFSQLLS